MSLAGARRPALVLIVAAGIAVLASLALFALGSPQAALAAGNISTTPAGKALSPVSPPAPVTSTPASTQPQQIPVAPVTTTAATAGGSISGVDALLLAVGAALVLVLVAYFILRDSRHHARSLSRAGATAGAAGASPHRGSKAPHKPRKLSAAERKRRKRGRAGRR